MKSHTTVMGIHQYYVKYVALCVLSFSIIYFPILLSGKMYMYLDIGADTYCNYWPNFIYTQRLLSNFSFWDSNLGLGSETSMQIGNYVADPFAWIVMLFPAEKMDIGIFLSLIVKYFLLSIVSFRYYSIMGLKQEQILLSSMATNFCGWFVGWGQHYHFATFFVLFIASLLFMENWLQKGKWLGLIFLVGLIAAKSAYFCYMTLLFMAPYYLIRRIYLGKKKYGAFWKPLFFDCIRTCGLIGIALLLGAFAFFPEVQTILASPRTGTNALPNFQLIDIQTYTTFILRLFSNSILGINDPFLGWRNFYESPFMYIGLLPLFFFMLALKDNAWPRIICGLLIVLVLFCVPISILFNAFSTVSYRWTFFIVPIIALVAGKGIEGWNFKSTKPSSVIQATYIAILAIVIFYIFYLTINGHEISGSIIRSTIFVIFFSTVYYLILSLSKSNRTLILLLCIFSVELGVSGYLTVINDRNLIGIKDKTSMEYFSSSSNELIASIQAQDHSFYRINKLYSKIDLNDALVQDFSGEKLYSSTLSPSYWDIRELFNLSGKNTNYFYGFETNQSLRDINCGKYMLSKRDIEYYGYKKIGESGDVFLYLNQNAFPFGTQYDSYITESEYQKLSPLEKINVLYSALVVPDAMQTGFDKELKELHSVAEGNTHKLPFKSADNNNILTITLEDNTEFPLVVSLSSGNGHNISGTIYILDDSGTRTLNDGISFDLDEHSESSHLISALGISKLQIVLDSQDPHINISLFEWRNGQTLPIIRQKQATGVENINISKHQISGQIFLKTKSFIYFPVVYTPDWKLTANGTSVDLIKVNGGFCAAILPEGKYNIDLKYVPCVPLLSTSISILTCLCVLSVHFIKFRFKKKQKSRN